MIVLVFTSVSQLQWETLQEAFPAAAVLAGSAELQMVRLHRFAQKPSSMHDVTRELNHASLCDLKCVVLLQEQAQAARKRAAGTIDEYTFIAEDAEAPDQAGSVPAIQQVSAEELYRKELAEEMQVRLQLIVNYSEAAAFDLVSCRFYSNLVPTLPAPAPCRTACTELRHMHALYIVLCHALLCFTAASWLTTHTHEQPLFDMIQYGGSTPNCDFAQAGLEDEEQAEAQQPAVPAATVAAVPDLDPEATVMMTRKQRGLYNAMQRGISKKRERAESLQAKAKKLKQPS